jgi:hypothetical protein
MICSKKIQNLLRLQTILELVICSRSLQNPHYKVCNLCFMIFHVDQRAATYRFYCFQLS